MTPKAAAVVALMLAQRHLHDEGVAMRTSAEECQSDARRLYLTGDYAFAARRAHESLAYTVGIMAPDFIQATDILTQAGVL